MSIQKSFKYHVIEELKASDFLGVLMRDHYQAVKRVRLQAERNNPILGSTLGWKPHLKEIINQVSVWPPKERILTMHLSRYLSNPSIKSVYESGQFFLLRQLPLSYFTPEFVTQCMDLGGDVIAHVPSSIHTESFYTKMIAGDGLSIRIVPESRLSFPLVEKAVSQNGMALQHLPDGFKSQFVCMMAIENNPMSLAYAPHTRINANLCMAAVKRNGLALRLVPECFRTAQLCDIAYKQKTGSRIYMPQCIMNKPLVASDSNGMALTF
jgi:hypothetical protein